MPGRPNVHVDLLGDGMKHIRNKNYAGLTPVTLRCGVQEYTGTKDGLFLVEDADADFLLSTPGWEVANMRPATKSAPAARASAPAPEKAAETKSEPVTPPESAPVVEEPMKIVSEPEVTAKPSKKVRKTAKRAKKAAADEAPVEGPDLDACLTVDELLAVADKFGIEVTEGDRLLDVDGLRAALDAKFYGEES